MQMFLSITLWLIIGSGTAYFANQRGRDPLVWFMLGMLLGIIALLILFLLPIIPQDEIQSDNPSSLEAKLEEAISLQSHDFLIKDWFYYDLNKERQGPLRIEELKQLWMMQKINEATYVWSEGMADWKKIEEIKNLHSYLGEEIAE